MAVTNNTQQLNATAQNAANNEVSNASDNQQQQVTSYEQETNSNASTNDATVIEVEQDKAAQENLNNALKQEQQIKAQATSEQTTSNKTVAAETNATTTVNNNTVDSNSSSGIAETMGDQYKVEEGDDYSWNKLASEMGQLYYNQESAQALADAVESKSELDTQATSAWNNYWAQEYSARQTQDKMGWTGGTKTASDLQTAFLQAEAASNMYTNYDLQKYGIDSKLSIARMYAEQQQDSLAQQYYQDAVSVALSEAEQTGYYISAENKELLSQYSVAQDIINGNKTGDVDRAKAVKAVCESAWDQQGFSKDADGNYIGVKTLATLEYEETVRSNQINEELQRQSIAIAQSQAEAAWAQVEVAQAQANATQALANAMYSSKTTTTTTKSGAVITTYANGTKTADWSGVKGR